MEIKEFLSLPGQLDAKIKKTRERIARWEELSLGIPGQNYDEPVVQRTRSGEAPFVKWIGKILEAQKDLELRLVELSIVKGRVGKIIGRLDDPDAAAILIYRYLDLCSWKEIEDRMNYNERRIYKLHEEALKELKKGEPYEIE